MHGGLKATFCLFYFLISLPGCNWSKNRMTGRLTFILVHSPLPLMSEQHVRTQNPPSSFPTLIKRTSAPSLLSPLGPFNKCCATSQTDFLFCFVLVSLRQCSDHHTNSSILSIVSALHNNLVSDHENTTRLTNYLPISSLEGRAVMSPCWRTVLESPYRLAQSHKQNESPSY